MQKHSNNFWQISLFFVVFFCLNFRGNGQNLSSDFELLNHRDSLANETVNRNFPKLKRKNLFHSFFQGSLRFYQKTISPQFSANCLYELSCSRFSQVAIQEFGIAKGLALTADRLARCNRISASTINPIRITENGKVIDFPAMYKLDK